MRLLISACMVLPLCTVAFAQKKLTQPVAQAVTVPAMIDQGRIIISAELHLPDGSSTPIRALVDTGNSGLYLSRRVATLLGLPLTCDDKECSSTPPGLISVGGMDIPLADMKVSAEVLAVGTNADVNIPASVLRHYDVLIDYPGHKFTIGLPGSIHFLGSSTKAVINADNGLIEIPSKMENKKYNLALDLGSSISFLSGDLFEQLAAAHPEWPHMTGAVGPANYRGTSEESRAKLMRVDRVQYGPLFLVDVPFVEFAKDTFDLFSKRAGVATAGFLGAQVFQNYRVGLDYAHATVYFDIGRLANFPDFDVVGLVLRPEDDGRFTVVSVVDLDGKPSVTGAESGDALVAVDGVPVGNSTMGQVWSALRGSPGQERRLTLERGGKQFDVVAKVQHFLAEAADTDQLKKQKGKH